MCGKEDWGNGAMPGSMIEEGRGVDGMNEGKGGTTRRDSKEYRSTRSRRQYGGLSSMKGQIITSICIVLD